MYIFTSWVVEFAQQDMTYLSKWNHAAGQVKSYSMDLNVMPTSFRGYNYLLVMHCNHSRYIITDTL